MIEDDLSSESGVSYSRRQRLFIRYSFAVLVDLTVLNLFNEYWDYVFIEYFSISLLAALLLQFLLQLTIKFEHYVAGYFKNKAGMKFKVLRGLSTWGILFTSKIIILAAINLLFGASVVFAGPLHGVVSFVIVVIAIIITEQLFILVNRSLA